MFKNTNQIMTSRFANVDGIAAIARITIKKVRTYLSGIYIWIYSICLKEAVPSFCLGVLSNYVFAILSLWNIGDKANKYPIYCLRIQRNSSKRDAPKHDSDEADDASGLCCVATHKHVFANYKLR